MSVQRQSQPAARPDRPGRRSLDRGGSGAAEVAEVAAHDDDLAGLGGLRARRSRPFGRRSHRALAGRRGPSDTLASAAESRTELSTGTGDCVSSPSGRLPKVV